VAPTSAEERLVLPGELLVPGRDGLDAVLILSEGGEFLTQCEVGTIQRAISLFALLQLYDAILELFFHFLQGRGRVRRRRKEGRRGEGGGGVLLL